MKCGKVIGLIGISVFLSFVAFGQDDNQGGVMLLRWRNSVDVTVGGTGLVASFNIGRIVVVKENYFVNTTVGIGSVPYVGGFTLPHQLTVNFGKKSSFLELGIGGTYWYGNDFDTDVSGESYGYQLAPIVGWRKYFKSNLIFRVYVNPLFHIAGTKYIDDYSVVPYGGISLGYSF